MRRIFAIALAGLVLFIEVGASAMPARAGSLTATADTSNCGLLTPVTNVGGLAISNYSWDCSSDMVIGNVNDGVYPTNSYAQLISYAPPGIAITSATVTGAIGDEGEPGTNWWTGSIWNGGGHTWNGFLGGFTDSFPAGSPYWGMQMWCLASTCTGGSIDAQKVVLTAVENRAPGIAAQGNGNIWWQNQRYIWNSPGDPWPMQMSGSDPSGVCYFTGTVGDNQIASPVWPKNQRSWQQCPNPLVWTPKLGAEIDTRSYVPGAGNMPLEVTAVNAAGNVGSVAETLKVDNDPVHVALSTPNDADTRQWVNHPVTVQASASAGPSGIGGTNCSVDQGATRSYPEAGVAVNGDGLHSVTCTAWNNALDPQGAPQSSSASQRIAVDEAPPSVAIEPQNPTDPTRLVVDTSDQESGVAGGSVQIARAGAQKWTSLPTTVTGGHLLARFDDARLRGPYMFRATSCDAVGNCAATDEPLTMPLRLAAHSNISFEKIASPAKVVRKRVRVGWHYARVRRHGKVHRIRLGGHLTTIRVVIHRNRACATKRVRTGSHRWHEFRVCRRLNIRTISSKRVPYGGKVTLHGLLTTAQGAPVANARVQITAAPDNYRLQRYAPVATVTTGTDGTWSTKLPAARSETIKATYGGSLHVLPASGSATMTVPAKIDLSITPARLPWADFISVHGHLEGGYVPPDGLALRFLVRYPHSKRPTSLLPLRTNSRGQFAFTWSYNGGQGVATYPMWIATTSTESDYPFGAAASRVVHVTFGVPTPPRQRVKHHPKPPTRWTKMQATRHAR